jgi:PRTRC genetic system protein E
MFKELAPLLAKRTLILTASALGEERIRVTITPRPTGKDDAKELAQPFTVEGTVEELDTELPGAIINFAAAHMTLEKSLADVKAGMEATLKEVKDEAAKKVAEAKKTNKVGNKTATNTKPAPEVKKAPAPAPPSLFDVGTPGTETPAAAPAAAPTSIATTTPEPDEDEEEEDEEEDEQDDAETPVTGVSGIAAAAPSSDSDEPRSMFDAQAEEEAEILREAFPDLGGQLIAA